MANDTDELAQKYGGTPVQSAPQTVSPSAGGDEIDSLAQKYGGVPVGGIQGQPASQGQPVPDQLSSESHGWAANLGIGAAKGIASTAAPLAFAGGVSREDDYVDPNTGVSMGHTPTPEEKSQLDQIKQGITTPGGEHFYSPQKLGYAGETLTEFLAGDWAAKGLGIADSMLKTGKIAKVLEASPKLMQALKLGAEAMRGGGVQAAQTLARTGDVKEAAKEGGEMAVAGGVLGGVGKAAGAVGRKLVKPSETLADLAKAGSLAPDNAALSEHFKNSIKTAETAMHDAYETGVQNLTNRLGSETIDAAKNPLQSAAKLILKGEEKAGAATHAFVSQAREAVGESIDKPVRELIDNIANGVTDSVDAEGKDIKVPASGLGVNDLIALRQTMRRLASGYEYGDINSRVIRELMPKVNDTIGELANQSGDKTAKAEYDAMNKAYGPKAQVFDKSNLIDNLEKGNYSDVANKIFSGDKISKNIRDLKTVFDPITMNHLSKEVFNSWVQDASGDIPALTKKFLDLSKRAGVETMSDFLGQFAPEGTRLMKETRALRNAQTGLKGLIAASGIGVGYWIHGLVGAAAMTMGESGAESLVHGLDKLSKSPTVWQGIAGIGKAMTAASSETAAKIAAKGAVEAANSGKERLRKIYAGTSDYLNSPAP